MSRKHHQRPTPRKRSRAFSRPAFSLIELVIVLAIAGIIAAIAAPRITSSGGRARALAAAKRIAADLEFARNRAIATSSSQTVNFNPNRAAYGMAGANPLNPAAAQYIVTLAREPYAAGIAAAAFGDAATTRWAGVFDADPVQRVVFDGYGKPDTAGWIVVASGGIYFQVSLDASGRTTYQEITKEDAEADISTWPSGEVAVGDAR